ncbi:MAG: hypothetical protein IJ315_00975 [Firmicutes bacterium]|nr:hypothetical protein [Bacillota bacterium]
MKNRIQAAFDAVKMDEGLQQNTQDWVENYFAKGRKQGCRWSAAVACFIFVLCVCGGYYAYFTPVSAINVDVEPAVELKMNYFDQVIEVSEGWEEVRYRPYTEALENILDTCSEYGQQIAVQVVVDDETKCQEMLVQTVQCTIHYANVYCHSEGTEDEQVNELKKELLFQQLQMQNPDITWEEVKDLTIAELEVMLNEHHHSHGHK